MVHLLDEMELYAKEHNIPIMESDGIEFLLKVITKNNCKHILEIGTAIGYSSIRMCLLNDNITVTTIERDEIRYLEAIKNIKKAHLENRITVLFNDAFDVELKDKFDLIFIDAAKSQYIKFFEKFKVNLKEKGIIVSDNLGFHNLVEHPELIKSKNVKALVRKITEYRDFLLNNKEFNTQFYEIGDIVGISEKKE